MTMTREKLMAFLKTRSDLPEILGEAKFALNRGYIPGIWELMKIAANEGGLDRLESAIEGVWEMKE